MEREYSVWEFGSRVSLSIGLAVILLFLVKTGAEVGALSAGDETLALMGAGALLLYGVLPTVQHATVAATSLGKSLLTKRSA